MTPDSISAGESEPFFERLAISVGRASQPAHHGLGRPCYGVLTRIAGKRDQLAGLIQEKYGMAKEQAEKELDSFSETLTAAERAVK